MNHVEIECPRCSAVRRVPSAALLLHHTEAGTSAWLVCHLCEGVVSAAVPAALLPDLVRAGCHVLDAPDRLAHPEQRPDGLPFVGDDVLALHELLDDDAAVADVLRELGGVRDVDA